MPTKMPPAFWLNNQLLVSEHLLAVTREMTALRRRVHALEHQSAKRENGPEFQRAIGLLRAWARFLATPKGQSLIALLSPAVAAFIKWLIGSS